jgi:hypothetical protein
MTDDTRKLPDADLDRFIALTERKRALQRQLEETSEELEAIGTAIRDDWIARGTSKETRHGWTVYLARDLTCKVIDRAALVAAAPALGMQDFLSINVVQLKSRLRELLYREDLGDWELDASRLPPELATCVMLEQFHRIAARKTS